MGLRGGGGGEAGDPLRFIRPAVGTASSPAVPRGLMKLPPLQEPVCSPLPL